MDRFIEILDELRKDPLAFAGAAANSSPDEARSIEHAIARLRENLQERELRYLDLFLRGYRRSQIEAVTGDPPGAQERKRDAIRRKALRLAASNPASDPPVA